jgi:hypothetical protein
LICSYLPISRYGCTGAEKKQEESREEYSHVYSSFFHLKGWPSQS